MALVFGLVHAVAMATAYHIRFDRPASLQKWDLPSGPLAHHLSILGSISQSNWDLELQASHFLTKQSPSICQSAGCHASIKKIVIALVHVVLSAFDLISMIYRFTWPLAKYWKTVKQLPSQVNTSLDLESLHINSAHLGTMN